MTRAGPRGRTAAPESRLARWLERLAILLVSLALSVGLMMPGWTFSMTRSITASVLLAEYATCVTTPCFMYVGEATTTVGTRKVLLTWSGPLLPFWVSSSVTTISVLFLYAALPMIELTIWFVAASLPAMSWNVPGWSLNSST